MDGARFDTLTRSLTDVHSRRGALATVWGGMLGLLGWANVQDAAAKNCKKIKDKKKRKKCRKKANEPNPGTSPPPPTPPTCAQTCTGCCDTRGVCQTGTTTASCGTRGEACESCTGDEICTGGDCVVPACGAGGPCLVFVTSTTQNGDLGGLSGADLLCQQLAGAASLPGIYRAWLSTASQSPDSSFTKSTGPYRRRDGVTIADNYNDLTDGALAAPINVTETEGVISTATDVWTHTQTNGAAGGAGTGVNCADWQSSQPDFFGDKGVATSSGSDWSVSAAAACSELLRLYCFQQS